LLGVFTEQNVGIGSAMESSVVARLDYARYERTQVPEVIFAAGKTLEENVALMRDLHNRRGFVLATRVPQPQRAALRAALAEAVIDERSGSVRWGRMPRTGFRIAVVCAGTSDLPVADEAAFALEALGHDTVRATDVGVAGIHRLFDELEAIRTARAVIVVAGMEGALPSVVAGLVRAPVIAVPTSVGYGASFEGLSALLCMLNACAPGIGVVNIDNGFGAAALAHKIVFA
jgi:pyridinium-3,5-biscarboxylic acid mononucleotide synthase